MKFQFLCLLIMQLSLLSCLGKEQTIIFKLPEPENFKKYWYHKGAEITRFDLSQARYGENHKGSAVHIFVTEKFNPEKQVKADYPDSTSKPILKLNAYKRFYTGIYPYTIMTSSFNNVNADKQLLPYKISTSVSEWCGHVFNQFNLREKNYEVEVRSYFESEGDKNFNLPANFTEDGLFSTIRLNPNKLPLGESNIIPFSSYIRMVHKPLKAYTAKASLAKSQEKNAEGKELVAYTLSYPELKRELIVYFEANFPFEIHKWTESYPSIKGGEPLTTSAVKTHQLHSAYWGKNSDKDRALLKKLGLSAEN